MAHEIKVSTAAASAKADAWATLMDGGFIQIWDGAKPATANAATAGTLLATGTMGSPAFGAAINGLVTSNPITQDSDAAQTGTAQYYRLLQSDGLTPMGDGTIGLSGGGFDLEMPTVNIVQHGVVTFPTFTHQESLG